MAILFTSPWLRAQDEPAHLRFTYENPQLQPAKYTITVNADGSGQFVSQAGTAISDVPGATVAGPQDRPIHVSRALREEMFAIARKNRFFAIACDAHVKNIAFQGAKTLEYAGPDGHGSCQYNWSKNAQVDKLTDSFQAIAATLDEGAKLERQYEHGRLSLDRELDLLTEMVQAGRAAELENIAPILGKLAGDEAVLQRVQRRSRALLEQAKTD